MYAINHHVDPERVEHFATKFLKPAIERYVRESCDEDPMRSGPDVAATVVTGLTVATAIIVEGHVTCSKIPSSQEDHDALQGKLQDVCNEFIQEFMDRTTGQNN